MAFAKAAEVPGYYLKGSSPIRINAIAIVDFFRPVETDTYREIVVHQ